MPKLPSLTVREVSAEDDTSRRLLRHMHDQCFASNVKLIRPEEEFWFIAWDGDEPAAFAGLGVEDETTGYLCRSGVLPRWRGNGLQLRLIRNRERRAAELGLTRLVSDTTGNLHSANNLIRAGYRLFEPEKPWAFENTLYWERNL